MILLEIFRPYFERLIEVLICKGQLPENDSMFTSEDKESFRCYRVDISDTMVKKIAQLQWENRRYPIICRCVCIMFWVTGLLKVDNHFFSNWPRLNCHENDFSLSQSFVDSCWTKSILAGRFNDRNWLFFHLCSYLAARIYYSVSRCWFRICSTWWKSSSTTDFFTFTKIKFL